MPENELTDNIRNKLQSIKTTLEVLMRDKTPHKRLIEIAIQDFKYIEKHLLEDNGKSTSEKS